MTYEKTVFGGRSILIVEDEYFVAMDAAQEVKAFGGVVLGPTGSVGEALHLMRSATRLDGAILDVKLDGDLSYAVADELAARGVPFVFVTGYDGARLPSRFAGRPRQFKPMKVLSVGRALFGGEARHDDTGERPEARPPL